VATGADIALADSGSSFRGGGILNVLPVRRLM
jgi:hypothetical protein